MTTSRISLKWLARIALGLFGVAGALIALEIALRCGRPQNLCVPMQDEVAGIQAPRPNTSGRQIVPGSFDTQIRINAQRFRDTRLFTAFPPPGVVRIAVLGDSLAFGIGADNDETCPARLEKMLNRQPSLFVEVINAANGGTGTGEQCLWYAEYVRRFHPRIVVLTVYENDLEDDLTRDLFILNEDGSVSPRSRQLLASADASVRRARNCTRWIPFYDWLAGHSHVLAFARNSLSQVLARARAKAFAPAADGVPPAARRELTADRELVRKWKGELGWLALETGRDGAGLVVVFVSGVGMYESAPRFDAIRRETKAMAQILQARCGELHVPFVSCIAAMDRDSYHVGRDRHPNPIGYEKMANEIAPAVLKLIGPASGDR
jgi:lysophospholipase L1-like esterase